MPEELLKDYRIKLDAIDENILSLLAERIQISEEVGKLKKNYNLPVFVPEREKAIIERLCALSAGKGIDPQCINELYSVIFEYSRKKQSTL